MIISKTPLRLSLVGGGSDMPSFTDHHAGAVISTAIDKYIYVFVNPKFDGRYRVSYSRTENVDNASEIEHDIVREAIKMFQLKGLEVVSVSDIPGEGSGLGSSSAFAVGLMRALYAYCNYSVPVKGLAESAFMLEGSICGHPIGRQDAYASAFGGLRFYEFWGAKSKADEFLLSDAEMAELGSSLMLFWTGTRAEHGSHDILSKQMQRVGQGGVGEEAARFSAELARKMRTDFEEHNFQRVGRFVHTGWALKKRLSDGITNDWIDQWIGCALQAGAEGAKICGAGSGGFLLVIANPMVQGAVENAVGLRRVRVHIGMPGSAVVYEG